MSQSADLIWYLLALVLVGSALLSRRLPLRTTLGMILIWAALFIAVAGLYTNRAELGRMIGMQTLSPSPALSKNEGSSAQSVSQSVRIPASADGHYWVTGQINGRDTRFLIDSGASITALSGDVARSLGLNIDSNMPGAMLQTANGPVVAQRSSVASLVIGSIQARDLPVVVSDNFGEVNVLGMNFLSQLRSWKVENGEMVLTS